MEAKNKVQANNAINLMSYLMAIQFASRMAHFALNLIILRFMSPESYGISSLQLPFVATAVTRVLKEALHRVAVREKKEEEVKETKAQHLVIVWLSIPFGIFSSSFIAFVFLNYSANIHDNPWMFKGLIFWLISSWIELALEPVLIYTESHLKMNISLIVEVISLAIHSIFTISMLFYMESVVLLQSYGQLVYSICLLFGYYFYAFVWDPEAGKAMWPSSFTIRSEMITSIKPFLWNSFGKYVSAEGEHFIMFFFGDPSQQGIFEFVHNLGSIVARIAFLSIEKAGFLLFSRLKEDINERKKVWTMLLSVSMMISILYLCTCPPYIFAVIKLLYGSKWSESSAPFLLGYYGVYLFLIGINGLVEAHKDAVSPYSKIQESTPYMFLLMATYFMIGAPFMYYFGAAGLITASCINTLVKAIFNLTFFKNYLLPISEGIPPKDILAAFLLVGISGLISRSILGDSIKHLGIGMIQGVILLTWLFVFKWRDLKQTWQVIKQKKL